MNTLEISKKIGYTNHYVVGIILKFQNYFSALGELKFEILPSTKRGGRRQKVYLLNRAQQDFLIILLNNNKDTIKEKFNIVSKNIDDGDKKK